MYSLNLKTQDRKSSDIYILTFFKEKGVEKVEIMP
jgi:hypothetical protein